MISFLLQAVLLPKLNDGDSRYCASLIGEHVTVVSTDSPCQQELEYDETFEIKASLLRFKGKARRCTGLMLRKRRKRNEIDYDPTATVLRTDSTS